MSTQTFKKGGALPPRASSRRRHKQRGSKSTKPRKKPVRAKNRFEKLLDAFQRLPEPTQVILIIGILLLLAWLITWFASHPDQLHAIFRIFQLWLTAKGTYSYLYG
jgi:hypothetical protein